MTKIGKRTVDAIRSGEGDVFLWDDIIPGFGVRCRPSGIKVYFLKYRTRGGRQRWFTLGRHGPMTPAQARSRAMREMAAVSAGADPAGARKHRRDESTIAQLADRYLREHVQAHNKPSTAAEVRRIIEKRIKPALGPTKISDLSRADCKSWHQGMSATPYEANRALSYLHKLLNLAAHDWQLRADNPCTGIKKFPERARERFFSDGELKKLGDALAEAERTGSERPGFILLVRLLATTGMRLGEALGLLWGQVDLGARSIRLSDAKAGARTVHLGAAAVAILDVVDQQTGFVIHGTDPSRPLTTAIVEKAWNRLRARAGLPDARLHDLRHTVGTLAALSGANAFVVRDLLGHRTLAMTARYVERVADMVRATADVTSNRIAAALSASEREPTEIRQITKRA
jgi:integrase